ncbi:HAD family hydrolase [Caldalkalibacillus salinus]|uniref:HAD family hydrolase n=1 Tax=Caldalkalibacillus salinus TaxID=2803787 RepID=UPI00192350F5|nr:HAD family hydrolase [Caldalkalibacillus salinus]
MTKAILFDLDGTLLPMDTEQFVENYVKRLAKHVAQKMDPKAFVDALWKATQAMIENKERHLTNEQVFEQTFLALSEKERADMWPLFDEFYETVFPTLADWTKPTPIARKVVQEALDQGYKVAVATNPVFPHAAIAHRLTWADLDDLPFEVVTVYENSTFTKPHAEYYQAICDKLNLQPEACIMVGNDMQEDMVASRLGMKTFLVEEYAIDRGTGDNRVDKRGTLSELYEELKLREGLFERPA